MKEVTYDGILGLFMANYGTPENWLRSYGGSVKFGDVDQSLSKSSEIKIKFSRPIVFPRELISVYDPSYRENVPKL